MAPRLQRPRDGGFTLVEVVFAITVLAIGMLMLSVSLSSSERMSSLARERAIANNILRAFIERMRQQYPTTQGSGDMTKLLMRGVLNSSGGTANSDFTSNPTGTVPDSTPIYDLSQLYSSGLVEKGVLKNATANVLYCTDETGANWGFGVTASITAPTTVSAIALTTSAMTVLTVSPPYDDKTSLGLPRDLNGDGTPCGAYVTGAQIDTYGALGANNATHNIVLIPMKVELTWTSGNANAIGSNQKMTIYAIFSPQH